MSRRPVVSMAALIVCLGVLAVPPAVAQYPPGPSTSIKDQHQRQYDLMRDMAQEMAKMTEQMSRGALTPEQKASMAQKKLDWH